MNANARSGVVTGASTGIGRAIAVALGRDGWTVALLARRRESLEETASCVAAAGGKPLVYCVDLRDIHAVLEVASSIRTQAPALRLIANVAGVWHDDKVAYQGPPVHETPTDQILEVMQVGGLAPLILTGALLGPMVEAKAGHVINISGTFYAGAKGWLHYYVSKKAIEAFTIGLAQELRRFEIQVNCVCPADVATEAYRRFYPEYAANALQPEEVAELVVSLLAPQNRHLTGQIIEIRNRSEHE